MRKITLNLKKFQWDFWKIGYGNMNFIFIINLFLNFIYAKEVVNQSAADICMESASRWVIKSEAKQSKVKQVKIQVTEKRSLGSGANLYLMSLFVEGPNIGDNIHWEVVGEFLIKNESCKILLGKRYWAH